VEEIVETYVHVRRTTDRIRGTLAQLDVPRREIWYEDIYTGDRETRLDNLNALFGFLGFSLETIEAHQADIEAKIFAGGRGTADILQFVPNLAEVKQALGDAAQKSGDRALASASAAEHEPADADGEDMEDAPPFEPVFTAENGFRDEDGLGYNPKEVYRLNAR